MVSKVFLACPSYGGIDAETVTSIETCIQEGSSTLVYRKFRTPFSLLAMQFNDLWCQALNEREEFGYTHFSMIHADIAVQEMGWMDKLILEMQRVKADVLSVVIAIKNNSGDVSTAIHDSKVEKMQRLNLEELRRLPLTFTVEDLAPLSSESHWLCINTGLWICDFTKIGSLQDKDRSKPLLWFEIRDTIKYENGKWTARNLPEDWHFSLQCKKLGLRMAATRMIKVVHLGRWGFSNQ